MPPRGGLGCRDGDSDGHHVREACRLKGSDLPTYSLVVPAYNEEGVIEELTARLAHLMDLLDGDAEAILVDDGSRDRT